MSATATPSAARAPSSALPAGQPLAVHSYLMFEGRCEEALNFYRDALGADVSMVMRYKDAPKGGPDAGNAECAGFTPSPEKVMHASFRIGSTELMASDGRCTGNPHFAGITLSLPVPDAATADRVFNALATGGQVIMPLGPTFYSPRFGMVTDRFGMSWMVIIPQHCI